MQTKNVLYAKILNKCFMNSKHITWTLQVNSRSRSTIQPSSKFYIRQSSFADSAMYLTSYPEKNLEIRRFLYKLTISAISIHLLNS